MYLGLWLLCVHRCTTYDYKVLIPLTTWICTFRVHVCLLGSTEWLACHITNVFAIQRSHLACVESGGSKGAQPPRDREILELMRFIGCPEPPPMGSWHFVPPETSQATGVLCATLQGEPFSFLA